MKYITSIVGMITLAAVLSSCGKTQINDEFSLQHGVAMDAMNAQLSLRVLEENDGVKKVGIVINNPHELPIQSVRSWIQFDPSSVRLSNFLIADERFILFAPGEKNIDDKEGMIKLGGAVRATITDQEVIFASFVVRKLHQNSSERSSLTFYDWKAEGDGHTAVLSIENQRASNIVQSPSSLTL